MRRDPLRRWNALESGPQCVVGPSSFGAGRGGGAVRSNTGGSDATQTEGWPQRRQRHMTLKARRRRTPRDDQHGTCSTAVVRDGWRRAFVCRVRTGARCATGSHKSLNQTSMANVSASSLVRMQVYHESVLVSSASEWGRLASAAISRRELCAFALGVSELVLIR